MVTDRFAELKRLNEQTARQLGMREHSDDCICRGKGYLDAISGPVPCPVEPTNSL